MTSLLKKLSNIDTRTKYGVYGWIREAEKELQIANVPLTIHSICILYIRDEEEFDEELINDYIKLSHDKKCVTKSRANHWSNNSYGTIEIQWKVKHVYQWNMKISKNDDSPDHRIIIGVSNVQRPKSADRKWNEYIYAHCSDGETLKPDSMICKKRNNYWRWHRSPHSFGNGDIISMTLNLDLETLTFSINGSEKFVIDKIHKGHDIIYRMFVSIYGRDDSVRLL